MKRLLAAIAVVAAGIVPATLGAPAAGAHERAAGTSTTASVIGGRAASIAEFPWLAFIAAKDEEGPFSCTGTVVAPRVVLTAGHCIEKPRELAANPPSRYRVVTGAGDLKALSAVNVSAVSQTIFYPNFETARLQIDAGLLILSAPVAAPALAIAGPTETELEKAGTLLSIAGWGLTKPEAMVGPSVLRTGELVLKSPSYCRRNTRPFEPLYSTVGQLCALDTPSRTLSGCFGDSGGPAIARRADGTPVEVGIIVSGGPECSPRLPNIYTRLSNISAWVSAWIASAETGVPPPPVPTASPPYLSFEDAKEFAAVALGEDFGSRFRRGTDKRISCARRGWARVKCKVAWRLGAKRFRGAITISYAVDGYEVIPEAAVRIRFS